MMLCKAKALTVRAEMKGEHVGVRRWRHRTRELLLLLLLMLLLLLRVTWCCKG
jgi:hypothetical protein